MKTNEFQNAASAQASEFSKVFAAHASKIAAAQQQWLQSQADALKSQFEQVSKTQDFSANAQTMQSAVQPATENFIKHAQALHELTLAAQKDLAAKAQEGYKELAAQASAAIEAGVKQMPNQGEPMVGMAKNATQAMSAAFEQVAEQVKTAQANYEDQIAKLFDGALNAVSGNAKPAKAAAATKTAAKK